MVKQWFVFAAKDLRLAKHTLDFDPTFKSTAGFLAQQAAEKAIKGFMVWKQVRFKKTHDMGELSKQVVSIDQNLSKIINKHKGLSKLAVTYRYPDAENKPLTLAKVKSSIKSAELIYQECFNRVFGSNSKNSI
jgi:HEPN domain-containing protein